VDDDLTTALAAAVRSLARPENTESKLSTIVDILALSLPSFKDIGVSTIDRNGGVQTRAATSQLVWDLDALQYELGEGPCVDSLHDATVVEAPRIVDDPRWPRYVPRAVELGLKSQLALKLYIDEDRTIGGLNMYSTSDEEIDPDAVAVADLYATQAAVALGQARTVEQLTQALETRQLIGQAVGLVMAKYGLAEDAAFGFLARMSSHSNTKLREIAERVVAEHVGGIETGYRPD
jgi:GAF domain-containing protein